MDISTGGPSGLNSGSHPQDLIRDGSDQTFMQDVIEPSKEAIVLVDFWAPWCGPCKQLGPTLEKVVEQAGGAVQLVKINIDENQGIAGQLGVRSVPTVFAFKDGQPVNGFQGALPESKIKDFIKNLGGGGALEQIEQALETALTAFQEGNIPEAAQIYAQIVQAIPDNVPAIAGLARCYVATGDLERASQTLELAPEGSRNDPMVKSVITALELADAAPQDDAETSALLTRIDANPEDFDARFEASKILSANGDHERAADQLLAILEKDVAWNDNAAKEQLLKIFEAAGPMAEVSKKGRRRLSSILFN